MISERTVDNLRKLLGLLFFRRIVRYKPDGLSYEVVEVRDDATLLLKTFSTTSTTSIAHLVATPDEVDVI